MYILGLNGFHADSSAALIRDGQLIAAAEEERFRRIKHWAGFPQHAIEYCLREAGIKLNDVNHIAINHDPSANLLNKLAYTLVSRPDISLILNRMKTRRKRSSIDDYLATAFPDEVFDGKTHTVEHHRAHMSSAFHVSPFKEAVILSIDGFGDFASVAWGMGREKVINVDGRVLFPHSLGIFYQALTQWLGFPHYGDEYKVMGLAPYGNPKYVDNIRRIITLEDDGSFALATEYFRHHRELVAFQWEEGEPTVGILYSDALMDLLGPSREQGTELTQYHKDIARSVQVVYEETFFHLLNSLHRRYHMDSLALAGGCAMNSVANGKVYRCTPFKRLYVQSAAGDAGGAIGAAYTVWHEMGGRRGEPMTHAYWGPAFSMEDIGALLDARFSEIAAAGCDVKRMAEVDLFDWVAAEIEEGKVIGWFQGRMEWGPRALGNRSIVCDPRRADMKDILNHKIKRRESFRPFAPSILREHVAEWFEEDDDVPFMMQVFQVRESKRLHIPAVTHVDGSGRLQTVERADNPRYYGLIEAFERRTGVPLVLNTSFNENEPVVCRPEEALACFLRTRMDLLVLGDFVISRLD